MKWDTRKGVSESEGEECFYVHPVGEDGFVLAEFYRKVDAEGAVADHNACEQFADPAKAVELLEGLATRAASNKGVRHMAARVLAHPALQPPGETK